MVAGSTVRILHLSDFHFRKSTAWDSDIVLEELAHTIQELVQSGQAPDLVCITGDVAFSGLPEEYGIARGWIDKKLLAVLPKLTAADVLIVPGNHDVNRDEVNPFQASYHKGLFTKRHPQNDLASTLEESATREQVVARHRAFLEFAKHYGRGRVDDPWWVEERVIRGLPIRIMGLCSSLFSTETDYGLLWLSRWQVNKVFRHYRNSVNIALKHHPWSYLAPSDQSKVRRTVRNKAHLILSGHEHEEDNYLVHRPWSQCLEFAAGACYSGGEWHNAFHLIELQPASTQVRVYPFTWKYDRWQPDLNNPGTDKDGMYAFQFDFGEVTRSGAGAEPFVALTPVVAPSAPAPEKRTPASESSAAARAQAEPATQGPTSASDAEQEVDRTRITILGEKGEAEYCIRLATELKALGYLPWVNQNLPRRTPPWEVCLDLDWARDGFVVLVLPAESQRFFERPRIEPFLHAGVEHETLLIASRVLDDDDIIEPAYLKETPRVRADEGPERAAQKIVSFINSSRARIGA